MSNPGGFNVPPQGGPAQGVTPGGLGFVTPAGGVGAGAGVPMQPQHVGGAVGGAPGGFMAPTQQHLPHPHNPTHHDPMSKEAKKAMKKQKKEKKPKKDKKDKKDKKEKKKEKSVHHAGNQAAHGKHGSSSSEDSSSDSSGSD